MKKLFAFLLVGALLLTGISGALAQGPEGIVWSSAYQIQNLDTEDAAVHIDYYAQGTTDIYSGDVTVPGSGSLTIFPFVLNDNTTGPGTFNGSAVLSSDKAIAAILNTQTGAGSTSFYGASTQGFSSGATAINLPLIACNNGGFDTWFNIQNVGTGDADVTVTYVPGLFGNSGVTDGVTISSMRAKTFDQRLGSTTGTKTCTELADTTSGKFVGGATIVSDEPVVATVMFLGTGSMKAVQGYNGFTAGSTAINLPLIMANNSNYYTSIQIQNTGTGTAEVVVDYGTGTYGNTTDPGEDSFSLPGGESKTIIHLGSVYSDVDWSAFGTYVGGATITQDGTTEPLVAVVNQNRVGQPLGSTYEGIAPLNATNTINLPLVAANNNGYNTGIQIQAIEDGTSVTLTYSENSQQAGEIPTADTFTLDAGESKTLIQMGAPGSLSGVNDWNAIGKYVGSAVVSANKPILAIVNFNGPATGDTFYTYDGFNQ